MDFSKMRGQIAANRKPAPVATAPAPRPVKPAAPPVARQAPPSKPVTPPVSAAARPAPRPVAPAGRPPSKPAPGAATSAAAQAFGQRPVAPQRNMGALKPTADDFDGIEAATTSGARRPFIQPGTYWLRIDRIEYRATRTKEKTYRIDSTVLLVVAPDQNPAFVPHHVGAQITHWLWQKHDSYLGNLKGFLAGAHAWSEEQKAEKLVEVAPDLVLSACGDGQPLQGIVLEVRARNNPMKNGGNFTVVDYHRRVTTGELTQYLSNEELGRYFDENAFGRLIADENEAGASSVAGAVEGTDEEPVVVEDAPEEDYYPDEQGEEYVAEHDGQ